MCCHISERSLTHDDWKLVFLLLKICLAATTQATVFHTCFSFGQQRRTWHHLTLVVKVEKLIAATQTHVLVLFPKHLNLLEGCL
ncbi:hypothetical protein BDP81DRAFT_64275 [Colletotrichum phormii]|uniref:Uncharacterized protein n=1 Tax=Colletotrichum phormii TaxID=359342 RepID=A0AAI9ZLA1_9PEZI|nr:uncharacterized protein BDP81DRAFT_64275 [Colletotrichum phormii]KAK1633994.1 hypothetical protein BDP81DRAFT_64275 [Colletotrichum phormii]